MCTFLFLFGDVVWLSLLELVILAVFLLAVFKDRAAKARIGRPGLHASVKRGEKGWSILLSFWAISIIIIEIIVSSEAIASHRVVIGLVNVAVLLYLNLFSAYFKNKIVGWWIKLQGLREDLL
jgi:hypothetical protein